MDNFKTEEEYKKLLSATSLLLDAAKCAIAVKSLWYPNDDTYPEGEAQALDKMYQMFKDAINMAESFEINSQVLPINGGFLPQIETPKPESAPVLTTPRYLVFMPESDAPPFYTNWIPDGVNAVVVDVRTQKYSLPANGNEWHDVEFDTL